MRLIRALLSIIMLAAVPASAQIVSSFNPSLRAPINVYVATAGNNGSDSNDCLAATVTGGHGPCATGNHAILVGTTYLNVGGASLGLNYGAGSFTDCITINYPLTGAINLAANPSGTNVQPGQIMISGAGSGSTTITGCPSFNGVVIASNYAVVGVRAATMIATGNVSQSTLFAQLAATINIYDDFVFGAASVDHIHIEDLAQVEAWYSYTISGGAAYHIAAGSNGVYLHNAFPSGVITLTGTPAFSGNFAFVETSATIQFNNGVSFSGSATGSRYSVNSGGTIKQNASASLTFLPGNAVGTNSHGHYVGSTGDLLESAGTFTPGISFGGGVTGITYSTQSGSYEVSGKRAFGEFSIVLTSKGSSTGVAVITGFPFTSNNALRGNCIITFYSNMATITGFTNLVNSSATSCELRSTGAASSGGTYNDTNFTNTTNISGTFDYLIQ